MSKLPIILKYANPVMLGYGGYKFVSELIMTLSGSGSPLGHLLALGLSGFFLYLAWLNWQTVRLRRLEGRPPEKRVMVLNAVWLLPSVGIALYLSLNVVLLIFSLFDPMAIMFLLLLVVSWLEVLYVVANIIFYYSETSGTRAAPDREQTGVDRPSPPPDVPAEPS